MRRHSKEPHILVICKNIQEFEEYKLANELPEDVLMQLLSTNIKQQKYIYCERDFSMMLIKEIVLHGAWWARADLPFLEKTIQKNSNFTNFKFKVKLNKKK